MDVEDNYRELLNAMIVKAANDYRFYYNKKVETQIMSKKELVPERKSHLLRDLRKINKELSAIKEFFLSSKWFNYIDVDGADILSLLNQELSEN